MPTIESQITLELLIFARKEVFHKTIERCQDIDLNSNQENKYEIRAKQAKINYFSQRKALYCVLTKNNSIQLRSHRGIG